MTTRPGRPALRVGMVGLGMQGAPIAEQIIKGGYPMTVWARRPETVAPFLERATVAPTMRELGAVSDLVCVCVLTDQDVEDVLAGEEGVISGMQPGSMIAIHSTVSPDTCRAMAELAAKGSVTVVDAPVSGSAAAAREGRLLVMVGGDPEAAARVRPVLETFGNPVVRVGGLGAGQLVKLVNNLVLSAQFAVLRDAVALAEGLGIDGDRLRELLHHGTAASRALDMLPEDQPLATVGERVRPLLGKDADLAFAVAREAGADLGVLEAVVRGLFDPQRGQPSPR